MSDIPFEKIDDYRWRIPQNFQEGMRVPGLIYADESLIEPIKGDKTAQQVANVASLPGIVKYSLAMPDIHWGYGFPIGGVAATDPSQGGVISPGGVGFDINCGIRLVRSNLELGDVSKHIEKLVDGLFANIPCGVGSRSSLRLSRKEQEKVLVEGAKWVVERGYGTMDDVAHTEEKGALPGADPSKVSQHAMERGYPQQGTLGAGNHFLEIQVIEKIYEPEAAKVFGLEEGQVTVMIHCGSRGLGHQICTDYLRVIGKAMARYGIHVPDRQLACVPVNSKEGKDYSSAMACAANYAWANRQLIMHWVRETFQKELGMSPNELGMKLVYDVAHNIAKFETHEGKKLCVHRKGATRAFPAGHPDLPEDYREVGQPVIIPGDMGRNSYVLVGTERAMDETWGSTCHGAGRVMSRHAAIKAARGKSISKELQDRGVTVRAKGRETLAEEAPEAYKDVNKVVEVVHNAGISRRVAKMRPIGVIKG
jgi:tRNA-splicing ligase RtcB